MADDTGAQAEPASKPTSKNILLVGHGGYDKLKVQDQERPTPGKGQVLINIKASGLNFNELMCRQGLYDRCPKLPAIMGQEGAGIVTEVGEEATKFKGGERVVCVNDMGLWAEYAVVDENNVFEMPDGMSFEEAAALPVTYLTAHFVLFNFGHLRPNQSVLIHMAAGGVGTAATQLCKTVDDVTIFGTASAAKHEQIQENGVTHPIDYRTTDYVAEVKKTCPGGVDIVMDPLSGEDSVKGFNLLKPFGRIIHYGAANLLSGPNKNYLQMLKTWWSTKTINPIHLMTQNKAVCGVHMGYMFEHPEPVRAAMEELLVMYKEGKIKPVIDSVWAFENVGRAMARMQERKNVGKVVLSTEKEPEPEPEPEKKKEKKKKESKKDKKEKKEDKKEQKEEKVEENGTESGDKKEDGAAPVAAEGEEKAAAEEKQEEEKKDAEPAPEEKKEETEAKKEEE